MADVSNNMDGASTPQPSTDATTSSPGVVTPAMLQALPGAAFQFGPVGTVAGNPSTGIPYEVVNPNGSKTPLSSSLYGDVTHYPSGGKALTMPTSQPAAQPQAVRPAATPSPTALAPTNQLGPSGTSQQAASGSLAPPTLGAVNPNAQPTLLNPTNTLGAQ